MIRSSKSSACACLEPRLVARVDLRERGVEVVGRAVAVGRRERLGGDQLVLEVRDLVGQRLGRVALGVQVELARHQREQPLRVRRVVDGEAGPQPERARLPAQDPDARRVERGHPHASRGRSDQLLDPLAHLGRGLVGERDREDLAGPRPARGQEVADAVRQHPRLARTGARDDEQRAAVVQDCLALLRVQTVDQGVRLGLPTGPRAPPPRRPTPRRPCAGETRREDGGGVPGRPRGHAGDGEREAVEERGHGSPRVGVAADIDGRLWTRGWSGSESDDPGGGRHQRARELHEDGQPRGLQRRHGGPPGGHGVRVRTTPRGRRRPRNPRSVPRPG